MKFLAFYNWFKWSEIPKCVELSTPPNAIKLKLKKIDLGNSILKYDLIIDAVKVISYKNLKLRGRSSDIGSFGDIGTEKS